MACLPGSEIVNLVSTLAVMLVLGAYISVFHFGVEPFKRDFFCNDESISYPYKPDTVTMAVASVVGGLVMLLSVAVVETVRHAMRHSRANQADRSYASCLSCCCCFRSDSRCTLATVSICRLLLLAVLGTLLTEVVTVTLKTILGRQRPHFVSVCRANVSSPEYLAACSAHLSMSPAAVCRPLDAKQFRESMLSFPSGHSSHSMYMTVFAALYLQSRFTFAKGHAVKWFLQCLLLMWGLAVCASRVSDYKHHWSDVICGGLIGSAVGCLLCLYLRPSYINCCGGWAAADAEAAAAFRGGAGGNNSAAAAAAAAEMNSAGDAAAAAGVASRRSDLSGIELQCLATHHQ